MYSSKSKGGGKFGVFPIIILKKHFPIKIPPEKVQAR